MTASTSLLLSSHRVCPAAFVPELWWVHAHHIQDVAQLWTYTGSAAFRQSLGCPGPWVLHGGHPRSVGTRRVLAPPTSPLSSSTFPDCLWQVPCAASSCARCLGGRRMEGGFGSSTQATPQLTRRPPGRPLAPLSHCPPRLSLLLCCWHQKSSGPLQVSLGRRESGYQEYLVSSAAEDGSPGAGAQQIPASALPPVLGPTGSGPTAGRRGPAGRDRVAWDYAAPGSSSTPTWQGSTRPHTPSSTSACWRCSLCASSSPKGGSSQHPDASKHQHRPVQAL